MAKTRERFDDLRVPSEEDAQRRAWELARAAFDERSVQERAPGRLAALLVAAAAVVVVALAFTPPGDAVADWVERTVGGRDDAREAAALTRLPGGGRVLVTAWGRGPNDAAEPLLDAGALVALRDGKPRALLGDVPEAVWSPRGRFVAAARPTELIAVDRRGRRRWSVGPRSAVRAPRWSPSGFRVAYLSGNGLRVVNGDGTGDRHVGPASGTTAPAWLPGRGHVIAFAPTEGRIVVADLDRRRVLRRIEDVPRGLHTLATSARGSLLLAVGERVARIYRGRTGEPLYTHAAGRAVRNLTAAASPRGDAFAIVRRSGATSEVLLLDRTGGAIAPRRLFAASSLGPIAFSPDGRHLLVDWRETGSWLFLPTAPGGRTRQIGDVAKKFGAEAVTLRGWAP